MATYSKWRFRPTACRAGHAGGILDMIQFDEVELRLGGSSVAWPGGTTTVGADPHGGVENAGLFFHGWYGPDGDAGDASASHSGSCNAIDGSDATKALHFANGNPDDECWIEFDGGTPVAANGFRFKTGNDETGRDPISWVFEGWNGSGWDALHTGTSETITTDRDAWTQDFTFPGGAPTLSDVNTTESFASDAASVPFSGADLGADETERDVYIESVLQTQNSGDSTSGSLDGVTGYEIGGVLFYGTNEFRVENVDGEDSLDVDIDTPTGWAWVTIASIGSDPGSQYVETSPALEVGWQLRYSTEGGKVTVLPDSSIVVIDETVTDFDIAVQDGSGWSADQNIPVELPGSVPDVVGEAEADAITAIEAEDFVASVVYAHSGSVPVGDVISQSPVGGSSAEIGTTVTITVSLGAGSGGGALPILRRRRGR